MFTLLSGRHVHEGATGNEQLILSATTPAPSLGGVAPEVPPALVAIVDRALAFERAQRWRDAVAMQEALRAARVSLGAQESQVPASGQRPATSTVLSGGVTQARQMPSPGAATMIDTTGTASALAAWTKERETRLAEASRLRASIADQTQRYLGAKKHVAEAQATVEAARGERSSLGSWLERQVGTRTAAVEEARKETRGKLVAIARQAIADRAVFGVELDPAREQVGRLDRAAAAASRDVKVHATAIEAYDARSLRLGVMLMGVAAALLLALIVIPVVWRATRVVDAPPPVHVEP
jgi:hypothetical protein